MPIWSGADVIFFASVVTFNAIATLPPLTLPLFILRSAAFLFMRLPALLLFNFKLTTFERREPFGQMATVFEYAAVQCVRYAVTQFNAELMGEVILGETPTRLLYEFRRFRCGTEAIGDQIYEPVHFLEFDGWWMWSKSRKDEKFDVVLYFVPGNLCGFASSYAFLEPIAVLLVNLQRLGFRNPAAFVLDQNMYKEDFKQAIDKVQRGWAFVAQECPETVRVVVASSIGATLILSALLNIARPFTAENGEPELPRYTGAHVIPDALVLLSPLSRIDDTISDIDDVGDYVSARALKQLAHKFVKPEDKGSVWLRPLSITDREWWTAAMPRRGVYINAGTAEMLCSHIKNFKDELRGKVRVYLDTEEGMIHNWPILLQFVGRSGNEQQMGISRVAVNISHMVLLDCLSEENATVPKVPHVQVSGAVDDDSGWVSEIAGDTFGVIEHVVEHAVDFVEVDEHHHADNHHSKATEQWSDTDESPKLKQHGEVHISFSLPTRSVSPSPSIESADSSESTISRVSNSESVPLAQETPDNGYSEISRSDCSANHSTGDDNDLDVAGSTGISTQNSVYDEGYSNNEDSDLRSAENSVDEGTSS